MAMLTIHATYGADIAKDWVDLFDGENHQRIDNTLTAIGAFLAAVPRDSQIAVEPTNCYHETLVECALAAGHRVYLIDAYRLSRYRDAVGIRAKTDPLDAYLLHHYLTTQADQLSPYQPPPKAVKRLTNLLRVRAKLVQSKTALGLSLSGIGELARTRQALLTRLERAMALIDGKIRQCLERAGYQRDYQRCQGIPGIGPVNAAALVATFYRGLFTKADAFVAFMGLDVRVRESGRYRGKCKLSKRGNPELRRLLFNAARAAARTPRWHADYLALRDRGLSTTQAAVALSRKLARVAFALLKNQTEYQENRGG